MSSIHSKDTNPELTLRKALLERGLEFESNYCEYKIDIAFPKQKVAVFVDGCFWHGCPIHSHEIRSNVEYWMTKIKKNKERDLKKTEALESQGWIVLRFWEHDLNTIDHVVEKVVNNL